VEAADAAAAVEADAAAAAAAAEADEGRIPMRHAVIVRTTASALALALVLAASGPGAAEEPAAGPRRFESKEAAIRALEEALEANDDAALAALVGSGNDDLVQKGTDPLVAKQRKKLLAAIREAVDFETLDDGTMVPLLGVKRWPSPIPLVQKDGAWSFDAVQGRDEVLARRIGTNELRVIDLCRAVHDAQRAYRGVDRDGDGVLEFAYQFLSTPGKRDGLWWAHDEEASEADRSPLGVTLDEFESALTGAAKGTPFGGYRWKMLWQQGRHAPGGPHCFFAGPNMTRGFAVLAVPADYRKTGVKSFMISHHGRLLEKDLGPQGGAWATATTVFEPDRTWTVVGP
jgi:hypothetical protein